MVLVMASREFKKIAVCLEHRFYRVGDDVYTALSFPYPYWKDYLSFFDKVEVVARVKKVSKVEESFVRCSGEGVVFRDIPYYKGVKSFLINLPFLIVSVFNVVRDNDYFLLRSGNISNLAFVFIFLFGKRFIREYPGNIKDGIVGLMGAGLPYRLIASFSDWFARLQGRYSKANSFVSNYCRDLYGSERPGFVFSSFNSDEIKIKKKSYENSNGHSISLVSVGRLEREKGHYILLLALFELRTRGIDVNLTLIGDGSDRERLERYANENQLDVDFLGGITERNTLFQTVVSNDIFVIPSLTEGMPRALLEAMAMGLPCIGSDVGGIPEVLETESMAVPGDSYDLANKIVAMAGVNVRRENAERNRKFIFECYSNASLIKKRHDFWGMLYE